MKSEPFTAETMMAKAKTTYAAAKFLLEGGYAEEAASRAYYAMFYAARAALLASNAPVDPNTIRKHSGLIVAFGEHLVKDGPVSKALGSVLNKAFKTRLTADYEGKFLERDEALEIVSQTEAFVTAMQSEFMPHILDEDDDEGPGP
jgi:uncharacterized protein (UPF0332 family)